MLELRVIMHILYGPQVSAMTTYLGKILDGFLSKRTRYTQRHVTEEFGRMS